MKTHNEFVTALNESLCSVSLIASYLAKQGCQVLIKPTLVTPDKASRHQFVDDGDLEIRQRIEVKHRAVDFTSVDDYPYSSIIVDEDFKINRIPKGQLWGYVVVNRDATHVCFIKGDTRKQWSVEEKYDHKERENRKFYTCPKELAVFCRLDHGK
jgi:hypothetical protein